MGVPVPVTQVPSDYLGRPLRYSIVGTIHATLPVMIAYRLRYLDAEGNIGRSATIDCTNDAAAIAKAADCLGVDGIRSMEVWDQSRLVADLVSTPDLRILNAAD